MFLRPLKYADKKKKMQWDAVWIDGTGACGGWVGGWGDVLEAAGLPCFPWQNPDTVCQHVCTDKRSCMRSCSYADWQIQDLVSPFTPFSALIPQSSSTKASCWLPP